MSVGPIFAVVGSLLAAIALFFLMRTRRFLASAKEAPGKVIQMVYSSSSDSGGGYSAVYEFKTLDGQTIMKQDSLSSNPPRFQVGDAVCTLARVALHHTRLPAYVRGKRGVVERLHGAHVFADANAQGLGEQPQQLYSVVFDGAELWGDATQAGLTVSVDAWESYLELAGAAGAPR